MNPSKLRLICAYCFVHKNQGITIIHIFLSYLLSYSTHETRQVLPIIRLTKCLDQDHPFQIVNREKLTLIKPFYILVQVLVLSLLRRNARMILL